MAEPTEVILCSFCGKVMKKDTVVCKSCGYNTQTKTQDPSFKPVDSGKQDAADKPSGRFGGVVKIITTVAILFGILFVLIRFNVSSMLTGIIKKAGQPVQKNTTKAGVSTQKTTAKKTNTKAAAKPSAIQKMFQNNAQEAKKKSGLLIEGIFFDAGGKSFVTINGNIVSEGDIVGENIKIEKINKDSVVFSVNGVPTVLGVSQSLPLNKK
jgi:type II secretory pathway component PulC